MNRSFVICAALALMGSAALGRAEPKDPAANPALEADLRSAYTWTRADSRSGEVLEAGPLFVVRKDGIATNAVIAPFHTQNTYKDGQLKRSALNFFAQDEATAGKLMAGDQVYITKTEVKGTSVVLSLLSADTFGGMRAKASVSFSFPKGYLATAETGQVIRVIDELLEPIGENSPPASPAPTSATIALGATLDQVLETLGQPDIIAELGRKQIYIYPEYKVTFLDGIVASVE